MAVTTESMRSSGMVKMTPITVGTIDGDQAEIVSGVSEGDTVVIDGVDQLQDGSKVIVQKSGAGHGAKVGGADAPVAPGGDAGKGQRRHRQNGDSPAATPSPTPANGSP